MKKSTETELVRARCSLAEFGRLVGLTRSRIWQLKNSGLILVDEGGVLVTESLKRFYLYRGVKHFVDVQPQSENFQYFLSRV